jgi:DNA processing protein
VRNRIVVGLSSAVIIAQADIDSGSIRSAELSIAQNKPIFVLPHRVGDSEGTNRLIKESKANIIYDIDDFIESMGIKKLSNNINDEVIEFCMKSVSLDEALIRFGDIIYEYEFMGKITITNGKIVVI